MASSSSRCSAPGASSASGLAPDGAPGASSPPRVRTTAERFAAGCASPTPEGGGASGAGGPPAPGEFARTFGFGVSGWLFIYYIGVIKVLKAHGLHRDAYAIGSSGGAITAGTLFYDCDLDGLARFVLECVREARSSFGGKFKLREYVREAVERHGDPRLHERLSGRLEVSITTLPFGRNKRVNRFETYDDAMEMLLASSCFVPLAGLPIWSEKHGLVLDGGVSDFSPWSGWHSDGTFNDVHSPRLAPAGTPLVTVCPFYTSRADIKPDRYVPLWWCILPPGEAEMWGLYEMGQANAEAWIQRCCSAGVRPPRPVFERFLWPTEELARARSHGAEVLGLGARALEQAATSAQLGATALEQAAARAAMHASRTVEEARQAAEVFAHEVTRASEELARDARAHSAGMMDSAAAAAARARQEAAYGAEVARRQLSLWHSALLLLARWVCTQLVCAELMTQAIISATAIPLAPFRQGSSVKTLWRRSLAFSVPTAQLWLANTPIIGGGFSALTSETLASLERLSLLYRALTHVIHIGLESAS